VNAVRALSIPFAPAENVREEGACSEHESARYACRGRRENNKAPIVRAVIGSEIIAGMRPAAVDFSKQNRRLLGCFRA
jgi:hypothetical protein